MLPNPLKKLTRRADATTAKLLKALKRAQDAARLEILKATAKGGVAGDAAERERLYERIRREYQTFGREMDDAMSGLVQAAGKTATQGIADAGLDVHFSKKRLDAVWDYISPPNTRSLSAVFTDQMSENAIKQLRGAFLDTYRQAVIEGWTANETSKHMRDAWDGVAHDEDTFRFVDKSGKRWENARYLQMLHRTTAMRVERDYTLDRMADAGIQHFRVAGSGGECDICKAWEGQILTSVKTKGSRIPTYADAVAAGMFHPNCVHFIEPMDPDWGDDAEEIERQQKIPSPLEFTREAMQARRDKIELERYKAQGMTDADAKAEVTRSKLADAIRTGIFDREVSESVSKGMDPAILAELNKTGVPRFQMVKKGEEPGWNRGKAGGVVRTSRVPTAAEINGIIAAEFPKPEKAAATSSEAPKVAVKKVRDSIVSNKNEIFVVLNQDGTERFPRHKSGTHGGELPWNWAGNSLVGATFVHNHPSGLDKKRNGFGTSFSIEDVVTSSIKKLAEMRAVSPKRDYWIKPGPDGWPDPEKIELAYKRERVKVREKLQRQVYRGQITPDQASALEAHIVWKTVAKETGMLYGVDRIGKSDGV